MMQSGDQMAPVDLTDSGNRSGLSCRNGALEQPVFWNIAKSGGLGQKCRRQYIIGQYIVDFFFRQSMLIVEIDGGYHFTEEQQRKDTIDTDRVIENIKTNFI